ncbi:LuxR C-terminal-related transcriptional regulator [Streptomyces canus]|uniref:LuxR C-terminal-related transcriptional regulator n=1 Tax=Streptomyces canus TaxID=58343 RepID=UPI0036977589
MLSPNTPESWIVRAATYLLGGRFTGLQAGELHISESTVKFHVAKILEKLGVGSRGEAAALALAHECAPRPRVGAFAARVPDQASVGG